MKSILFLAETTTAVVTEKKDFWEEKTEEIIHWLSTNGIKLLLSLLVLFICFKIVNFIAKRIRKRMIKRNADKTATAIVYNVVRKGIKIVLFLMFLTYVGIDTASIGALLASLGVGIGLALQGSLSNLAGGIVIVIMRPFRLGDYIEAQGEGGTVEDIRMFYTSIITPDNRTVLIPNGVLANGVIRNNTLKDTRRVDFIFSVSFTSDLEKAKNIILEVCKSDERVFKTPVPFVEICEYSDNAVKIAAKIWTKTEQYWDVYFNILSKIKTTFDNNNIEIPYNKIDVQIKEINNEKK